MSLKGVLGYPVLRNIWWMSSKPVTRPKRPKSAPAKPRPKAPILGTIPDLLNLNGWRVTAVDQETVATQYTVAVSTETKKEPPACCRAEGEPAKLRRYGTSKKYFRDLPLHGRFVDIRIYLQRFQCIACKKILLEDMLPNADTKRQMTTRLIDYMFRQSIRRPFIDVAIELGVSEGTVRNVFRDLSSARLDGQKLVAPRVLGIDDKYVNGKWMTVFGDIENKTLIDICESRVHQTLGAFFDEEMPNPQAIQVICHDMSKGYRKFSLRYLPQRDIVVDKFHVIMKANQAIDTARIAISRGEATTKEVKLALRKERKIFLAKSGQLAESTRATRDERLAEHPELKAAYEAKEKFFGFYRCATKKEAASFYYKWLRGLSPTQKGYFKPLISCVSSSKWRPHIFNYFDHPTVTTGYLERLNRAINEISRAGKGYSFEILRRKLVLAYGERPVPPPKFDREGKRKTEAAALPPGEARKKQRRRSKAEMAAARAAGEARPKRSRERLKQGSGVRKKGLLRYEAPT